VALRKVDQRPTRIVLEFGYLWLTGPVLLGGVVGALAVGGALVISRASLWYGLGAFAITAFYAAYATGIEETTGFEVSFSDAHTRDMRTVAESLRDSVAQDSVTTYRVPNSQISTRYHLTAGLRRHYPHLDLDSMDIAKAELNAASRALLDKCCTASRSVGLPAPPPLASPAPGLPEILLRVALGQGALPTDWTLTLRSDGRAVLIANPPTFPLDVTGMAPIAIEQSERAIRNLANEAPTWIETTAYLEARGRLGELSQPLAWELGRLAVQELPPGSTCELCAPGQAPRRRTSRRFS
jgi:hypothetical protein